MILWCPISEIQVNLATTDNSMWAADRVVWHLSVAVRQPMVERVRVGQQVCGTICQALGAAYGQDNRSGWPVQAYDVRHIPCAKSEGFHHNAASCLTGHCQHQGTAE